VYGEQGGAQYLTLIEFYLRLSAGRAIKNDWDRKKLELTLRRKLKQKEVFVGYDFDVTRDSKERWTAVVRDFAKREMREDAAAIGLRMRPGSWPGPDYLPTFWFGESFYFAKILFVFVETEKELTSKNSLKAMPDMMDATHFRDAAYADVFVTQDENFHAVAVRARTGLRIMSFDEFATHILTLTATDVE